jgi:hypothetical protein
MNKPRKSSVIIIFQFMLLGVCAIFLGWTLYQNWFLKQEAVMLSSELGFRRAQADFIRGHLWLYEIKSFKIGTEGELPTDGISEPTGRYEGSYEIRALLTYDGSPAAVVDIRRVLVETYNQHMRQMHEKPEWFDANGFRIPNSKTNVKTASP